MPSLTVSLSERSYSIDIGHGNLDRAGAFLSSLGGGTVSHAVVLTDEHVSSYGYARIVADAIADAGIDVSLFVIAAGESSKSIETAATLWETLLEDGTDRKSVLVAVGGGVIGDLAGFIAATFARGIRFFQVPTTLLAQVDSSVGGKVGINLPGAKNMVGAFHQPVGVLIDTATLETLDATQYACGLGEIAKYAVSLDAALFERLESDAADVGRRDRDILSEIVFRCCEIKAGIVANDERETTGFRALLNYGHTFAHVFETLGDYRLPHGQAVAVGCVCAARLALKLGRVDTAFLERQIRLLQRLDLPTSLLDLGASIEPKRAVDLMNRDKKVENGRLRFVLPIELGRCELVGGIDPRTVMEAIECDT